MTRNTFACITAALLMMLLCACTVAAPADTAPSLPQSTAAFGGDSNLNGWKMATNGTELYYTRENPDALRRISAPFSQETVVFPQGFSYISLVGNDAYFWNYKRELYRADTAGGPVKLLEETDSIAGMWHYEGKLYYITKDAEKPGTIKAYDMATQATSEYDVKVQGTYPQLAVVAGYIVFTNNDPTEAPEESNERLCRMPITGGEPETVAENVQGFKVYGQKLYYRVRKADGSTLYSLDPYTLEKATGKAGVGNTYCIDGAYVYFTREQAEGNAVVRAKLGGEEETVLYAGHEASNNIIVFGDNLYFDEWKSERMNMAYYVALKDGSGIRSRDEAFPSVAKDPEKTFKPLVQWSYLQLEADGDLTCCFKLYDTDGKLVITEMLKRGKSKSVRFKSGKYVLMIAKGTKWISDKEAFGKKGTYMSSGLFNFMPNMSYKIGSGSRGDFRSDSQDSFTGG